MLFLISFPFFLLPWLFGSPLSKFIGQGQVRSHAQLNTENLQYKYLAFSWPWFCGPLFLAQIMWNGRTWRAIKAIEQTNGLWDWSLRHFSKYGILKRSAALYSPINTSYSPLEALAGGRKCDYFSALCISVLIWTGKAGPGRAHMPLRHDELS